VNYSVGFGYRVTKLGKTLWVGLSNGANSKVRCHLTTLMATHPIGNNEQP
jgi:hypothetical protein